MALKIFGTDPESQPRPRQRFSDDVVGRFRSGTQVSGRPVALEEWRVTTGDPDVADAVADILGDDGGVQSWDAKGEDNLEVFTTSKTVEVILDGPRALRQRMVMWGRQKMIYATDGEVYTYPEEKRGEPDPDAHLDFNERKAKGQDGLGPVPQIEVYFKIEGHEDLGVFKFQTGSWSMARDLASDGTDGYLEEIDGPARATLALEVVSFTAKSGPRAGKEVRYTKPVLTIHGPA